MKKALAFAFASINEEGAKGYIVIRDRKLSINLCPNLGGAIKTFIALCIQGIQVNGHVMYDTDL